MLLLIIPGIIAWLRYSQTWYILADNNNISPMDAIRKSKEMMVGNIGKLFVSIAASLAGLFYVS